MNRKNLGLVFQTCAQPGCGRQGPDLFRCGACRLVHYCGPEHQREHRASHKTSCNLVKQTRASVEAAEAELRSRPEDELAPANVFANGVGRFWGLTPTRPYMQCLHDYMTASLNLRTGEAVEGALTTSLEMLRLCRGDNQGVRSQVPVLYLRLGRDQEAFDFLKWYAVKGTAADYDWCDMSQPFLDLAGEDAVLEDVSVPFKQVMDLSFLASLTLLKTRLMLDLVALAQHEKMAWLREEALSDILPARRDIVDRDDYRPLVRDVTEQVARAHQLTAHHNKHYWPSLERPEKYANAMPMAYSWGSREETVLAFRQTWYAWAECAPALDTVRQFAALASSSS
ncbi:uncharacterized protein PG998_007773 [Apiospora kogelbergensis]|uniref:uncharacterized protein n=1 Tax=Apiospora kogelbergensis TaxID=1337665 RepID=UPI003131D2D6